MPHPPGDPSQPTPALAELAARAGRGDRDAFDQLHRRLDGALRRHWRRKGVSEAVADDLSQRTWMGVWRACSNGAYDPSRAAITTFVFAVATKQWLQHLRKGGRPDASEESLQSIEGPNGSGAEAAEALDAIRAIMEGRRPAGLSEQDRWLLRSTADGMTDRELAARLRTAPSTAHSLRKGAIEKLRRALGNLGFRGESTERPPGAGQ